MSIQEFKPKNINVAKLIFNTNMIFKEKQITFNFGGKVKLVRIFTALCVMFRMYFLAASTLFNLQASRQR